MKISYSKIVRIFGCALLLGVGIDDETVKAIGMSEFETSDSILTGISTKPKHETDEIK